MCAFIYLPRLRSDTVSIQNDRISYKTAENFATAISNGQAQVSVVKNAAVDIELMRFEKTENESSFWSSNLMVALQSNPTKLTYYNSWHEACERFLSYDTTSFGMQYDIEARMLCTDKIVKQLQIGCFEDIPADHIALLFYAKSPYREKVSRLAEFFRIQETRDFMEKGKVFASDFSKTFDHTSASIKSLRLLFMAYVVSLVFCVFACLLEILIRGVNRPTL